MSVVAGQTITVFNAVKGSGGIQDADTANPTGVLWINGVSSSVSVSVVRKSTGRYTYSFILPALLVGDYLELERVCTVDGLSDSSVIWTEFAVEYTSTIPGIYGDLKVPIAIRSMAYQRGTVLGIGDSNQGHNANGNDEGSIIVLSNLLPGRWCVMVSWGHQSGLSYKASNVFPYAIPVSPPSQLDQYLPVSTRIGPGSAGYTASGTTENGTGGIYVTHAGNLFNTNSNIRMDVWWGSFPTGTGQFRPGIRERGGFTITSAPAYISTNTGSYGIHVASVTIAAGFGGTADIEGGPFAPGSGNQISGSAYGTWIRCVDLACLAGFEYVTWIFNAVSAVAMAKSLRAVGDVSLVHELGIIRATQLENTGQLRALLIVEITNGLHQDDVQLSINGYPANTVAGFLDGNDDLINKINSVIAANWTDVDCYFVLRCEHVMDPANNGPEVLVLAQYRAALKAYVQTKANTVFVDQTELYTLQFMLTNSYYYAADAGNSAHLEESGYVATGRLIWNALWQAGDYALRYADRSMAILSSIATIPVTTAALVPSAPTVIQIRTEIDNNSTKLAAIDNDIANMPDAILNDSRFSQVGLDAGDAATFSNAAQSAAQAAATSAASAVTQTAPLRASNARGGSASTITLDTGASAVTGSYVGMRIDVGNDSRTIIGYDGTSKIVAIDATLPWTTNPVNGTPFKIRQAAGGLSTGLTATEVWTSPTRTLTSGGGATVVGPLNTTVTSRPRFTTAGGKIIDLIHAQSSSIVYEFAVTDDAGAAVDLSSDNLSFVCYDTNGNTVFSHIQNAGLVAAGNLVDVTVDAEDSADPGDFLYVLRNTTDGNSIIAQGRFQIRLAPVPA